MLPLYLIEVEDLQQEIEIKKISTPNLPKGYWATAIRNLRCCHFRAEMRERTFRGECLRQAEDPSLNPAEERERLVEYFEGLVEETRGKLSNSRKNSRLYERFEQMLICPSQDREEMAKFLGVSQANFDQIVCRIRKALGR